mmetsp:Transcript_24600/g.68578  ORF Transcript_24600/g.68578 Transcript_24600/m.68578 type:complete len:110 (+) Transcript_24600:36-365(+)
MRTLHKRRRSSQAHTIVVPLRTDTHPIRHSILIERQNFGSPSPSEQKHWITSKREGTEAMGAQQLHLVEGPEVISHHLPGLKVMAEDDRGSSLRMHRPIDSLGLFILYY